MQHDIERRKSERIKHESAILHNTVPPDFYYSGTMHNFSVGGLYFESNEDLSPGDEISISITHSPNLFVKKSREYFDVRIMWSKELQNSSYQVGYGAKLIR